MYGPTTYPSDVGGMYSHCTTESFFNIWCLYSTLSINPDPECGVCMYYVKGCYRYVVRSNITCSLVCKQPRLRSTGIAIIIHSISAIASPQQEIRRLLRSTYVRILVSPMYMQYINHNHHQNQYLSRFPRPL